VDEIIASDTALKTLLPSQLQIIHSGDGKFIATLLFRGDRMKKRIKS
jgi:hypothetical protein